MGAARLYMNRLNNPLPRECLTEFLRKMIDEKNFYVVNSDYGPGEDVFLNGADWILDEFRDYFKL